MSKRKKNKTNYSKSIFRVASLVILTCLVYLIFGGNIGPLKFQGYLPQIKKHFSKGKSVVTSNQQSGSGLYLYDGTAIPEYSKEQIITINNDKPFFTVEEINSLVNSHYFTYGGQDMYGRATSAIATVSKDDLVASETRKGIELPNPKGWVGRSKGGVYDRSHLIAYTLGGKNDLDNLVTGTISFNQKYMTQVEGDVRDYIKSSGHSVLYRVTPYYRGDELVPVGVLMEASDGSSFIRNRFVYNVQDGFTIDYKTGEVREN